MEDMILWMKQKRKQSKIINEIYLTTSTHFCLWTDFKNNGIPTRRAKVQISFTGFERIHPKAKQSTSQCPQTNPGWGVGGGTGLLGGGGGGGLRGESVHSSSSHFLIVKKIQSDPSLRSPPKTHADTYTQSITLPSPIMFAQAYPLAVSQNMPVTHSTPSVPSAPTSLRGPDLRGVPLAAREYNWKKKMNK